MASDVIKKYLSKLLSLVLTEIAQDIKSIVDTNENEGNNREKLGLQILLLEYQTQRDLINQLVSLEVQTVNFSIVGIGIFLGLVSQTSVRDFIVSWPEILLVPIPIFTIFGLMHLYEKFRIFCSVAYIEHYIKETLQKHTDILIFQWEKYLTHFYKTVKIGLWLSKLRNFIFLCPSISFLLTFTYLCVCDITVIRVIFFFLSAILIALHFIAISAITRKYIAEQCKTIKKHESNNLGSNFN